MARLGGKELLSKVGTTQGDPTMGAYALAVTPLYFLRDFIVNSGDMTVKKFHL